MKFFCVYEGIEAKRKLNSLRKEFFRKTLHICTAFVPLLLNVSRLYSVIFIALLGVLYSISEFFRIRGKEIPLISDITIAAARKRDENRFVLGPVTLVLGICMCALLWDFKAATIGILALAFGDGLASLAGKTFGLVKIPLTQGKTAAGSITCFAAIFCSSFAISKNSFVSLTVAIIGALVEVLPLKDFDNLLIPILLGGVAHYLL